MIKNLIANALQSEGSGLLAGLDLSSDIQGKAIDLAKDSVMGGMKNSLKAGNIHDITKAFSGGSSSSLVQTITNDYASKLISKLGLSKSLAKTISSKLIPMVFSYINKKEDAPTDNDDGVKGLLGDLMGGDIAGKLGGLLKGKFKF